MISDELIYHTSGRVDRNNVRICENRDEPKSQYVVRPCLSSRYWFNFPLLKTL